MYTLYHNKKELEIKVTKAKEVFKKYEFTEKISYYNDCYMFCMDRKPLVELAEEMKSNWVKEIKDRLELAENIKI